MEWTPSSRPDTPSMDRNKISSTPLALMESKIFIHVDLCRTIEKVDHQNDRKLTTPILT